MRKFLSDSAYHTFIKYGYYTQKHRNTSLRIVAINSLDCSTLNTFLFVNPTDPINQFNWLENILLLAEEENEEVYIIGHINPGDSNYSSECSKRYVALIERFSYIIRGQFYGHTHYDQFSLIRGYFDKSKITGMLYITASLTTFYNLLRYKDRNPSFRLYEVDSDTKIPKDYDLYYLNLTLANSNDDIVPKFEFGYKATQEFNITNLFDFEGFDRYRESILTSDSVFKRTIERYMTFGKDNYLKNFSGI